MDQEVVEVTAEISENGVAWREAVGGALHDAFHPGHPWSGCNDPDGVYDRWMPAFLLSLRADGFDVTTLAAASTAAPAAEPREGLTADDWPIERLIEVALTAFDPDHPKYRDNLATKVAGTVALRRASALAAAQPGPSEPGLRKADVRLLADATLGGTSYKPHREAADRVLAALAAADSAPPAGERLREALIAIRDMEPAPVDDTIRHDPSGCADCKRYEGHPISHGRCDVWYREHYAIERRLRAAWDAQTGRMRDIARAALADSDRVDPAPKGGDR